MAPARLVECLEILRWPNETLAEALGCDEGLVEAWALGLDAIPPKTAAWLEALTSKHAATEVLKPTELKGRRYTGLKQ